MASIPSFGPIGDDLMYPVFDDATKQRVEERRVVRANLRLLGDPAFSPRIPYTWGFTIYRAVPGQEQDARFTEGVRRLTEWMRWMIRNRRYTDEDMQIWPLYPDVMPRSADHDAWDDVAARLWNEVVEDYPNADEVDTAQLGEEDFSPVGEHFLSWVAQKNVDTSRRNSRYDFCLIIDETALQMLEGLPAETPPLKTPDLGPKPTAEDNGPQALPPPKSDQERARELSRDTWVWMLDRETMGCYKDGQDLEFPPWARIRLWDFYAAWFRRAIRAETTWWDTHIEEDKVQWDKIRWWVSGSAVAANEIRRRYRAETAAAAATNA